MKVIVIMEIMKIVYGQYQHLIVDEPEPEPVTIPTCDEPNEIFRAYGS